ncbi:N-acetyltransferase 9 [Porphyridium purpureum]|uniref:N-acetyltransferase 9 n=1 Tax=Porphyridium purpureum TaxID=35688 RepID=A0A5J4YX35_PORPP|nr:N-acetyltransferase 9 [Porphyridium purpureum]|eukprot:POR4754..scf209_3
MRDNENVVLEPCSADAPRMLLVPYKPEHVQVYHDWMADERIRELTCSERLTLEEEYENQVSWHKDSKKCTFIVMDADVQFEQPRMVGDVNIFTSLEETDNGQQALVAEVEVMIAEPASLRKGLATWALRGMMAYFLSIRPDTARFVAKVLDENGASLSLFARLGFTEFRRLPVFDEIHLCVDLISDAQAHQRLCSELANWSRRKYASEGADISHDGQPGMKIDQPCAECSTESPRHHG